jgi:hypothetical protein
MAAAYWLFLQEGRLNMQRRRVKHTTSLADRIAGRIAEIKAKAATLPEGSTVRAAGSELASRRSPCGKQYGGR